MQDWKSADVGGWYFREGVLARVLVSGEGLPAEGALVRVTAASEDWETVTAVPVDGDAIFSCPRSALVPDLDWENVPDPVCRFGDPKSYPEDPTVFFLSVFGRLKQVSTSRRTGEPIMQRSSRVWGWFPHFARAFRVVDGNLTDIHEYSYEYAMIEEIPPGISPMNTREWWWQWNTEKERWLKSSRPADYDHVVGLTLG